MPNRPSLTDVDTGGRRSLLATVTITVVIKTLVTATKFYLVLTEIPDTILDRLDKDVLSLVPDLTVVTIKRLTDLLPAGCSQLVILR